MSAPEFHQDEHTDFSTANGVHCLYCGATPAAVVQFRGHRGFVFFMQFLKQPGPFCRSCGLATYRRMTGESMLAGWWGPLSMVINPITMLINLPARSEVAQLPEPLPGSPYQPMDPGAPMYKRWQFLGILVPIAAIVFLVVVASTAPSSTETSSGYVPYGGQNPTFAVPSIPSFAMPLIPAIPSMPPVLENTGERGIDSATIGDCVWNKHASVDVDDDNPDMAIVPCDDPRAQAEVLARYAMAGTTACEMMTESDASYTVDRGSDIFSRSYTLCLRVLP